MPQILHLTRITNVGADRRAATVLRRRFGSPSGSTFKCAISTRNSNSLSLHLDHISKRWQLGRKAEAFPNEPGHSFSGRVLTMGQDDARL